MTELSWALVRTAGLALLIGAGAWLIGVSGPQSLFVASAVMTVGAGRAAPRPSDVTWPPRSPRKPPGTRGDVARLSWRLVGRKGAVTRPAVRRLIDLAEHRLARHGIDLHDPDDAAAAERLLGTGAYRVLMSDPARPVRYSAFVRCVSAVERLDDLRPAAPAATPRSTVEHRR